MKRELVLECVAGQTRLAVLEDGRLCEIDYARATSGKLVGNIYAGRVQNVLPGMNAAFVDIGMNKNAFLYAGDICMDTRDQQELKAQLESRRIEKMLRPGQYIVAQVVKDAGGDKGPRISGNLSLPGRLCVLIPAVKYAGVSKKIEDTAERERLHEIAKSIVSQHDGGVIIRTAAEGATADAICQDYERLYAQWRKIDTAARHSQKPRLIQSDGSLALRAVRDMLDADVDCVRTDDEALYRELQEYAQALSPAFADRIRLVQTQTPLFDLLRVDAQLENALKRQIQLKSGGTLVIDETEAMTVIDVNTAKYTGKKSLSETIFRLNCEAAEEIACILRLRDVGGIIIIDFIDMDAAAQREELLAHLREAFKTDRNHVNILGVTALGLVEMTRKKARRPLSRLLLRDCRACLGSGREWTHETTAYRAVREIWRRRRMGDTSAYRIRTGEKVAGWLKTIGLPEGTHVDAGGSDLACKILAESFSGNAQSGNEERL